ncbi:thiolase family protein, partial [Pseudomonas aeruginosa]
DGVDALLVDYCVVGAVANEGGQGHQIGGGAAVRDGLGVQVPGMTLGRELAAGVQAIGVAADQQAAGRSEMVGAGGVEAV